MTLFGAFLLFGLLLRRMAAAISAVNLRIFAFFRCFFRRQWLLDRAFGVQIILHIEFHGRTCRTTTTLHTVRCGLHAPQPDHTDAGGVDAFSRRFVGRSRFRDNRFIVLVARGQPGNHAVQIIVKIKPIPAVVRNVASLVIFLMRHDESITSVFRIISAC